MKKTIQVPKNGIINLGKRWADKLVEIHVYKHSIYIFNVDEHLKSLEEFNQWEASKSPKATDTKQLFTKLKKKNGTKR